MKLIKAFIAVVSLITAALLLSTNAHASSDGEFREAAIQRFKALQEDLALTPDQKVKVRGVVKNYKTSLKAQWSKGKAAREAMSKATLEHGPESSEAKAAAQTLGNVARDRALLIAKIATEVRPLLNKEQIKTLEKARSDFGSLMESKIDSVN